MPPADVITEGNNTEQTDILASCCQLKSFSLEEELIRAVSPTSFKESTAGLTEMLDSIIPGDRRDLLRRCAEYLKEEHGLDEMCREKESLNEEE